MRLDNGQKATAAQLIIVLGLISGLTPFAIDMYLPAIPTMATAMGSDTAHIQLSISAYLFSFSLGQLLFGPISDSIGRRGVTIFGLVLFFIASLAISAAETPAQLSLLRLLQGLGGAAVSVAIMASLRDLFSGNQLAKMTSYLMMVMALSPMIAPFIGAQLLHFFNWQRIFIALAALAVIALILYLKTLRESLRREHRHPLKMKQAIAGYKRVLSHKPSLAYLAINGLGSAPMFIFISASPFVYIEYLGVSSQHYAYFFGLNVILLMFHSWLNTRLLRHWGLQKILYGVVHLSLIPGFLLLMVALFLPAEKLLFGLVPLVALVIGMTSLLSANAYAGMMTYHPTGAGSAASIAGLTRFGFGALSGAAVNAFPSGDHLSMVAGMVAAALASWVVLRCNLQRVMTPAPE